MATTGAALPARAVDEHRAWLRTERQLVYARLVAAAIGLNMAIIALMFAMTAFLPYPELGARLKALGIERVIADAFSEDRLEATRRALEAYRLEMGVYPNELRMLVVRGLMDGVLLEQLEQQGYDYLSIGVDYELR